MKKTIERVKEILTTYPNARDDDRLLVKMIWYVETPITLTVCDFLDYYCEGAITSESTIRRARRKVQELYPELRGKKWHERHAQQEQVKKELGYEN